MSALVRVIEEVRAASDPAALAERLKAGVELLSDNKISLADFFRLLHELAVASGEETFTLSARPMVAGTAEFVFSSAAHCATVREALHAIARAYNILHGDAYNLVEETPSRIVFAVDDERFPYTVPRDEFVCLSLECTLIVLHSALCHLTGEDLTPRLAKVSTRRAASQTRANQALGFWRRPITYGAARYALAYEIAAAEVPIRRQRDPVRPQIAIHSRIISLIEARQPPATPDRLADAVVQALRDGLQFQDDIAARLGLSVATLRRRLEAEGAPFRELREKVLNEQARAALAEGADIAEIAERLGFSDARSFTRAFRAWNGVTPAAWRSGAGKA